MAGILSSIITRLGFNQKLRSSSALIPGSLQEGDFIAQASDPFKGQGLGITTFSTFGLLPGQLAVDAQGRILLGAQIPLANATYEVGVLATSGDGKKRFGEKIPLSVTGTVLPRTVSFSSSLSKAEGNSGTTTFEFVVVRSYGAGTVNIPWVFTAGTTDATDYVGGVLPTGGTLTMLSGQLSTTLTIQVQGDMTPEPDENATVKISAPSGYTAGALMTATLTIVNDDVAATMPTGANVALMAQDATTYNVIRNRSEPAALPTSLWGNPRPGNNILVIGAFGSGGATVTKDGVGEDGSALALRVTWPSGSNGPGSYFQGVDSRNSAGARVLPAGTYTFSYALKSNDGTSQSVKLESLTGGFGTPPTHTVTSAWQTFSYTFTLASQSVMRFRLLSPGTVASAGDILMDNLVLVPGNTAGTPPASDRHITKVGRFALAGQAIYSQPQSANVGGVEGHAFALRDASGIPANVSEITTVMAVKMDNVTVAGQVYTLLSNGATVSERIEMTVSLGNLGLVGKTGSNMPVLYTAGIDKAGWTTLIHRVGSQGVDIFIDGVRMLADPGAYLGGSTKWWGLFGRNYDLAFPGAIASTHIYERRLTDAEVTQAHQAAKAQILALGETYQEPAQALIAEGASNTATMESYVKLSTRLFNKRINFRNFAVAGAGIGVQGQTGNSLWGRAPQVAAQIAHIKDMGRQPILTMLCGSNDGTSIRDTPVEYAARHEEYWAWVRSQGALVVASTLTAFQQNFSVDFPNDSQYQTFNDSIRARAAAGKCDALADFAATSLGTWNTTDFADQVHMTPVGQAKAAEVLKTALTPLLTDRS